jgi:outer membrane biosynthesis protein TonB
MKKSLTALFALALAFVFGTATLVYADTAPAGGAPSADVKKDEKTEMKKDKKAKKEKKTKKTKKMKKEESKEAAPAAPAPAPAK